MDARRRCDGEGATMLKNGVIFCLLLVLLTIVPGCVETPGELTADEIVNRSLARYEATGDMTGSVAVTTVFSGAEYIEFKDYVLKKPNKFKLTDHGSKIETVSDGKNVWVLDLAEKTVVEHYSSDSKKLPDCDYGQILQEVMRLYRLELTGTETQSDRLCYVIEAIPENNGVLPERTIWIEQERLIPVRISNDYRDYQSFIQYENISFDVGVDDNDFVISLPFVATNGSALPEMYDIISIEEAQEGVDFPITLPSYTSNYLFSGVSVTQTNTSGSISLLYTNGSRTLIITQTPSEMEQVSNTDSTVQSYDGKEIVKHFGGNILLKFNCNQIEVAIIGQLDEREIIKIAESMRCAE